jgi:hypothetical protein
LLLMLSIDSTVIIHRFLASSVFININDIFL